MSSTREDLHARPSSRKAPHTTRLRQPLPVAAAITALCLGAPSIACTEPLVFADWTIPVPEGARVVEYADASAEDRAGNRIDAVEELVIEAREGDDNYAFFNPRQVGVDAGGRIYVLDAGNSRIQVFDAGGTYLRTLGAEGSGPGEFRPARGGFSQVEMIVTRDGVVAYDGAQSRLSAWASDGSHRGDHALTEMRPSNFLSTTADGSIITETIRRADNGTLHAVVRMSETGVAQHDYLSLPRPGNFMVGRIGLANPTGDPGFAASDDGSVYATPGDEYQVLAFSPDGAVSWALRVAHERTPLTEEDRTRVVDLLENNFPDLDASNTVWPSNIGSISRLAVDGHGHLYVFFMQPPFSEAPEEVDVDVYAPDGTRLFTGTMPSIRWTDADGDFVYALRPNDETEENEPVRYRLVEPFE